MVEVVAENLADRSEVRLSIVREIREQSANSEPEQLTRNAECV